VNGDAFSNLSTRGAASHDVVGPRQLSVLGLELQDALPVADPIAGVIGGSLARAGTNWVIEGWLG